MFFMNRRLVKQELIDLNELSPEEEAAVFAILKPLQGAGDTALYLESEADAAIEEVRRRPSFVGELSFVTEAAMNTTATGEELLDRFFDRLATVLERFAAPDGAGQKEPPQRMLTPEEAAEAMHLNSQTVMRWCREGRLSGSKVGRNWLVPREAIDAYIHRQRLVYERGVK